MMQVNKNHECNCNGGNCCDPEKTSDGELAIHPDGHMPAVLINAFKGIHDDTRRNIFFFMLENGIIGWEHGMMEIEINDKLGMDEGELHEAVQFLTKTGLITATMNRGNLVISVSDFGVAFANAIFLPLEPTLCKKVLQTAILLQQTQKEKNKDNVFDLLDNLENSWGITDGMIRDYLEMK